MKFVRPRLPGEYRVQDISYLDVFSNNGSKYKNVAYRLFVSSPCIRQLSSFHKHHNLTIRNTLGVHFSFCVLDDLFASSLLGLYQKVSLTRLAQTFLHIFHQSIESVRNKMD